MKLRIWSENPFKDSLKFLVDKWNLKRTTTDIKKIFSKETENSYEYWIEINTLEDLFKLQEDLFKDKTVDNNLVISKWAIFKWEGCEHKKIEEGIGLEIHND